MKSLPMKTGVSFCLVCFFCGLVSAEEPALVNAAENTLPEWSFSAQNTLRMDQYEKSGDITASPYPFEGSQIYNDYNLNAKRKLSEYETVEVQAFGVINESDYRRPDQGLILERGKLKWEKGDSVMPFSMELGDFFGQQTPRTLQRSLKGFQLELQPEFKAEGQEHSIQLFSGISNGTYRELDKNVELFSGASWLMQDKKYGAFSLTLVHNYKEDSLLNTTTRDQVVSSLAWGREFQLLDLFEFEAEGELAKSFDDEGTDGNGRKDDKGIFGQISGGLKDLPLSYRIRYERYGNDFRPGGASISSDQETKEAHLGWRFENGMQVRTRLQTFRTALESANTIDTDVWGLNINGPLLQRGELGAVTGQVDFFVQGVETANGLSTNTQTENLNVSLQVPIIKDVTFRPSMVLNFGKNQNSDVSTINRQYSGAVDYSFKIAGLNGAVSPSINVRHNSSGGGKTNEDVNPALSLSLSNKAHSLRMSYNAQVQNTFGGFTTSVESTTQQSSLNYLYTWKQHQFGIEANQFHRDPRPGQDSEAYRVGLSWTYNFDRPAIALQREATADTPREISAGPVRMIDLAPGDSIEMAQQYLDVKGFRNPAKRTGLLVYEGRFLNAIERRQQLALVTTGSQIDKSVLVIEFENVGDIDSAEQTFERVRKVLNQRYGSADFFIEEGEFSRNLYNDVASGRFKRVIEWMTPKGRVRFGIPRRTDGIIRMEIQHARSFPAVANPNWSVEELR